MIRWFYKYGFVIYLFNTILYSISWTKDSIAPIFFYLTMGFGIFFLILTPDYSRQVLFQKSFLFLMIINLVNLVYLLFFDSFLNISSLEYLMARFMSFSLICLSIHSNFNYYKKNFQSIIVRVISLVVVISLMFNPNIFSGRYEGIIWNPNMFASLTVLAFCFLFLKTNKKTLFEKALLVLLLIVTISTGSRSAMIAIIMSFIFKYGLTFRNVVYSIVGIFIFFIISNLDLNTSINRLSNQMLFNDRIEQFSFAIHNIQQNLLSGYGLSEYSGLPSSINIPKNLKGLFMGAHNGYLSILIQYGIIFGGLVILIIFNKSLEIIRFYYGKNDYNLVYLFLIVYTLIAANFESLITGINEFHTILFWFALSYLSYSKSLEENAN